MLRNLALIAVVAIGGAMQAIPAAAHAVGVSRGEYRVDASGVRADLVFARGELALAVPSLDADRDGALSDDEVARAHDALAGWVTGGIDVLAGDAACAGTLGEVTLAGQDGIAIAATYRCPQTEAATTVRLRLLGDLSLGHRHLLSISSSERSIQEVLYEAQPVARLAGDESSHTSPWLVGLGFEHILTGYDHLCFLLALVLVGGSLRSLLGAVTAFTLAHSITLAVAALGLYAPLPSIVEPAIALSIVFVGVENCVAKSLEGRWRLTFCFGLIHGFGFAGALREISLPASQLPLALASFNVGVEAGQLAVLSLVVPTMWWLCRRTWFPAGALQACSLGISGMGLVWFASRVFAA